MHAPLALVLLTACAGSGPTPKSQSIDTSTPAPGLTAPPGDSASSDSSAPIPSCIDSQVPVPPDSSDCDLDGLSDADAIASGQALDCDADGLPDECDSLTTGCVTDHPDGWMEYRAGTLPIVLCAPHGGSLRTDDIDDRPDASTGSDLYTQELAEAVADALEARTGQRPHMVLLHLHRHEVEANAWSSAEGTAGQTIAEDAYLRYHALIDRAKEAISWRYGRGLMVDLHGLAAHRTHNELGYLLSGTSYAVEDTRLAHPGYGANSSLRAAEVRQRQLGTGHSFSDMVRGPQSIGGLLEARGYTVVPSPNHPWPTDEDGEPRGYFDGGYTTGAHGSRLGGTIDGLQIEHTWDAVRSTAVNRDAYAEALAESLEIWLQAFQQLPLTTSSTVSFLESEARIWEAGATQELWLERRGDLSSPLAVELTTSGTATPTVDLALPTHADFAAGERFTTVQLQPVDDANIEGEEALLLSVVASSQVLAGKLSSTTVAVSDDESPAVWWMAAADPVVEGTAHEVRLQRDDCPDDIAPILNSTGLEGFTLHHPELGPLVDGDPIPLATGSDALLLSLESTVDGVVSPRRTLSVGSGSAEVVLERLDGDSDAQLASWLAPLSRTESGVEPAIDHARLSAVRPLPSTADGPMVAAAGWSFDGVDDSLLLDDSPLPDSPVPFTVAWWFRGDADNAGSYGYMLSHGRYSWSGALNVYLTSSGTLRTVPTGAEESYDVDLLDVPDALWDDSWHHLAVTVSESDGTWTTQVYLDGLIRAQGIRGAGGVHTPGLGMFYGSRHDTWSTTHFQGELADLRVVHRAWSAEEVASVAATRP